MCKIINICLQASQVPVLCGEGEGGAIHAREELDIHQFIGQAGMLAGARDAGRAAICCPGEAFMTREYFWWLGKGKHYACVYEGPSIRVTREVQPALFGLSL